MTSFQQQQAEKILSMYNNVPNLIKSEELGGEMVKGGPGSGRRKNKLGVESDDKKLNKLQNTEGVLTSPDGEKINYRIYSDGWVKLEGLNMRKDFNSKDEALRYIKEHQLS